MTSAGQPPVEPARPDDGMDVLLGVRNHRIPRVCVRFSLGCILTDLPGKREDGTDATRSIGKRLRSDFACSTT